MTALTVVCATFAIATRADAAEKAIWGPTTLPNGSSAFETYQELGVDTLQLTLSWSAVASSRPSAPTDPADPAYRWPAELDRIINEAASRDIKIGLLVAETPPWANGGRPSIWAPQDPNDFARFLAAAARRYSSVRRWMIWGETNKDDRFQPNQRDRPASARAYAPLLDAAYVALKRLNRRNKVIGGMTWTSGTVKPADFLRWMRLPSGRRPRLDWFGHNPFPFRFPKLADGPLLGHRDISDTDTFSREIRRAYKRTVPLWLSEYTIQSDRGSDVFATYVSRKAQARYITAGFKIADDMASRVAGLGWFSLLDQPVAVGSANWGLMTSGLQRKSSFGAMLRAPSLRYQPITTVRHSRGRGGLRVKVMLRPRRNGIIRVELRRGSRRLVRSRLRGKTGRRRTVRFRHTSPTRGLYTVRVVTSRGATVRRKLRVR